MKYIIGTGWWSSDIDTRKFVYGDDYIRSKEFSELWINSLLSFTSPNKIIVIDSNSPIKSTALSNYELIEYLELGENGGHASNIKGKYCGWFRGVAMSMLYTYFSGADYYVYVEQDGLLKGDDIIEHCISKLRTGFMFGKSNDYPQPLQQSFFIIKSTEIEKFISRYLSIKYDDDKISCEMKFALCTSPVFSFIPKWLFLNPGRKTVLHKIIKRFQVFMAKKLGKFDFLPVFGGRDRPLNFNDQLFYFQHGTGSEIKSYIDLCSTQLGRKTGTKKRS